MSDLDFSNVDFSGINDEPESSEIEPSAPPLTATVSEAFKTNPDAFAKQKQLSRDTGTPVSAVEGGELELEADVKFNNVDFIGLEFDNPGTSNFLKSYDNAVASQDDISILQRIEDTVRSIPAGLVEGFGMGVEGVGRTIEAGGRMTGRAIDTLIPDVVADSELGQAFADLDKIITPYLPGAVLGRQGNLLKEQAEGIADVPAERQNLATDIGKGLGQVSGQIVTSLVNPTAALGLMFGQGVDQQGERQEASGAEGQDNISDLALIGGGAVTAVTEKMGLDALMSRIPPQIKNKIARQLADVSIAGGIEAVQEVVEGVAQGYLEQITTNADAEIFEGLDREAMAAGGVGVIVRSFVNMLTPGRVKSTNEQTDQVISQGEYEQNVITKLNDDIVSTKMQTRDADTMKSFIEQVDGDQNTNIFIDGAQAAMFMQEKTPDEIAADPALEMIQDQVREAATLGGDVVIPIADFAKNLAGTDTFTQLQPHMTLSPEAVTPFRADQAKQETESYVKGLMTQAEENTSSYIESQAIYEDVKKQLIDSGQVNEQNAKVMAQVVPAWATVYAQKNGISVEEAYKASGLHIEGPQTGERARLEGELELLSQEPAYKEAPVVFDDIKDKFLTEMPEDADVDEVMSELDAFTREEQNFLKALEADDWLGFEYPAQAISAAMGEEFNSFDPSQRLKSAIGRMVNVAFGATQPMRQPELQQMLSMDEDAFIQAVNPEGKIIADDDVIRLGLGDFTLPETTETVSSFEADGQTISVVSDDAGNMYAVNDNSEVLGLVGPAEDNETSIDLVSEAKGLGVGKELAKAYLRKNPMAPAGGFTKAGEATYRAAFRELKAEQDQMLKQSSPLPDRFGVIDAVKGRTPIEDILETASGLAGQVDGVYNLSDISDFSDVNQTAINSIENVKLIQSSRPEKMATVWDESGKVYRVINGKVSEVSTELESNSDMNPSQGITTNILSQVFRDARNSDPKEIEAQRVRELRTNETRRRQDRLKSIPEMPADFDQALQQLADWSDNLEEFKKALNPDMFDISDRNLTRLGRATMSLDDEFETAGNTGDVTIFRALPEGEQIEAGDWVSFDEQYASGHETNVGEEGGTTISMDVSANEVYTPGADENEWVYVPKDTWGDITSIDELWQSLTDGKKPDTYPEVEGGQLFAQSGVQTGFKQNEDGTYTGYKVMALENGVLRSGADSRQTFDMSPGTTISMPGDGVFLSNNPDYVMDYYSGLADDEVLIEVKFNKDDINFGESAFNDREPEIGVSDVEIVSVTPVDDYSPEIFRQDQQNLFVAHNLSAENLIAANELGGLAAPSLAVARSDISDFSGFGEITLLANPSLLEDSKARTFDADVYTPRQPRATYKINQKKYSKWRDAIEAVTDGLNLSLPYSEALSEQSGADNMLRSDAVKYKWLKEQGKEPKLKNRKVDSTVKQGAKFEGNEFELRDDPKFIKLADKHYRAKLTDIAVKSQERAERFEDLYYNDDGTLQNSKINDFANEVVRYRKSGGKDLNRLRHDISDKFRNEKLRQQFETDVTEDFNEMVDGKTLFKGFTDSGNKRFTEYNMVNVVREMTQSLQGGEVSFYGAPSVRSAHANEMKTIAQIQSRRDQIIPEDDLAVLKEDASSVFENALEDLKPFYKFDADGWGYAEDAGTAIMEGPKAIKEAFNVTPEVKKIVDDLVEYLSALPSTYFEAKVQRAVDFSEFDTAVVPKGANPKAVEILKNAGVKIKRYDPKVEGSRAEVIAKQKKLLFQGTRGYYDPANSMIRLTEAADLSTFLHEFAHFMYEMELKAGGTTAEGIQSWFKRNADDVAKEANGYMETEGEFEQVAYHGTPHKFDKFDNSKMGTTTDTGMFGKGFYFTDDEAYASSYAKKDGTVLSVELELNNPYVINDKSDIPDIIVPDETMDDIEQADVNYSRMFTEHLQTLGHDGVVDNLTAGPRQFVVFDSSQIKINKDLLSQSPDLPTTPDGSITPEDVINYIDNDTTGDQNKDLAIRRAVHEQFARGFETYLMEGKAPSVELRNAFRTFARWLSEIYKSIRGQLNVNLDDEMRQVLDRMLATEEQIEQAETRARYQPMFTDAAMGGMTDDEFKAYNEQQTKVKDKQSETLRDKLIKEITRTTKQWWKEQKADITTVELEKLKGEKVYITQDRLRNGEVKLDLAVTKEMVGVETTNKLGFTSTRIPAKLNNMTKSGGEGIHPDEAAALFGYTSGAEMLNDLINVENINKVAGERAEEIMKAEHGDILNDGTIEKEADDAVQNEERGKLMLQELKLLRRGVNQPALERQTIKAMAEENIGKLSYNKIFPNKYRKAEIKAAQESATALTNGDKELAANAKARQVLNYYLGMAATEARAGTDKIVTNMSRYNKKKVREAIMKNDHGYWEQIEKILTRFDFRKSATLKAVDEYNQSVESWMNERMETAGDELSLSNATLNELYKTHWKNVPYSTLTGISDSVKNIEHVARYGNKIDMMGDKVEFETAVADWTRHMDQLPTVYTPKIITTTEDKNFLRVGMAQMTKIPFLASWLDGGERVGMSHEIMMDGLNKAGKAEQDMWKSTGDPVMDAIMNRSKDDIARHMRSVYIPELPDGSMIGSQVLAVALNTGNAGNLRKMLLGEGWADPEVEEEINFDNPKLQAVLKHMTKSDWELVQLIWDQMDQLFTPLAEVHRKSTGLTPGSVEAEAVNTPYGTFKGGYYPVVYDHNRSADAARNKDRADAQTESMFGGNLSLNAQVNAGATNERTGYYGPINLNLDVIPNHFQETIHYITHHEPIRQLNRLITDRRVRDSIISKVGPDEYAQLKPWLNDIAKDGRAGPPKTMIDAAFGQLRMGVTLGVMGFKASTGIIQLSGIFNTYAEVGPKHVNKAMRTVYARGVSSIKDSVEFAFAHSNMMETRTKTMDREIKNALDQLKGKKGVLPVIQEASMKHIAYIQFYGADIVSWHAGYTAKLEETGDVEKAYKYADWVVENVQGSGATKDMATLMRNQSKTHTTFTMFMTFFSSLWNMERDLVRGGKSGKYSTSSLAAKSMFLFTLPVIFEMLMRGEVGDEDDELAQKTMTKLVLYPLASVPFVRDVASGIGGDYGYNSSPVASVLEKGLQGTKSIMNGMMDDEEITKSQAKSASQLAGAAFKIPGISQAWATGEHIWDVVNEGEELTMHQLLFGPTKEQ